MTSAPNGAEALSSFTIDDLAQEIRRVDGNHSLGAGALAEALMPFLSSSSSPVPSVDVGGDGNRLTQPMAGAAEHFGWIYHSPDTGWEWSDQHPIESGEMPDAEDVQPATLEVLHAEMISAWQALQEERNMRRAAAALTASPAGDDPKALDAAARSSSTEAVEQEVERLSAEFALGILRDHLVEIIELGDDDAEGQARMAIAFVEKAAPSLPGKEVAS